MMPIRKAGLLFMFEPMMVLLLGWVDHGEQSSIDKYSNYHTEYY
jgi:hypothetical protein